MKAGRSWGRLAALACALLALPLVAAAAAPPAGSEKPASVKLPEPLTREAIRELVARLTLLSPSTGPCRVTSHRNRLIPDPVE